MPMNEKELKIYHLSLAKKMLPLFGYRNWMAQIIVPKGETINPDGQIIEPKPKRFRRTK